MERLIDPIMADLQTEHAEALRGGRWWRVAWTCARGYAVFWKVVALHMLQSAPGALWNGMAADGWALGCTIAYSLVAFIALTLLLAVPPMIAFYSRVPHALEPTLLLVPQALPLSIGMAVPLGIVCGVRSTRLSSRRARGLLPLAIMAALLSFAAMLILPDANQAFRVALAEELGLRGVTKYSLPKGMNELSLAELASRSQEYEARGLPETARKFERTYHLRMALPVATAVLSLLAVGVTGAIRARAWRVAAMVVAFGLYWATLALGELNTNLSPGVSVWAPNIVFSAMALVLLKMFPGRLPQPVE